jgi:hypothetical protein
MSVGHSSISSAWESDASRGQKNFERHRLQREIMTRADHAGDEAIHAASSKSICSSIPVGPSHPPKGDTDLGQWCRARSAMEECDVVTGEKMLWDGKARANGARTWTGSEAKSLRGGSAV